MAAWPDPSVATQARLSAQKVGAQAYAPLLVQLDDAGTLPGATVGSIAQLAVLERCASGVFFC
ncbi:hypothetical protein FYA61_06285 [Bordetella holmesii]|nr:hypothetical protein FYA61_06285 [Bordetella holmesii]